VVGTSITSDITAGKQLNLKQVRPTMKYRADMKVLSCHYITCAVIGANYTEQQPSGV